MSVYQVNKLLYLTDSDPAFRKRITEAPEAVLAEFRLTDEERAALTRAQWANSIRWACIHFCSTISTATSCSA